MQILHGHNFLGRVGGNVLAFVVYSVSRITQTLVDGEFF